MSDFDPTRLSQGYDSATTARGQLPEGYVLHHTYEIVRLIASGGMGNVYEAKHLLSGDRYAIKVIRDDLVDDERISAMFIRESDILKRIRHDAVVNYGGLLQDEQGRAFLVMDYIDGPSLRDRLRQKALSADEAKRLLRRVATGLAEVHGAGTFHRDLSPDNILLPDSNLDRAVIIDFGIAKLSEPDAKTFVGGDVAGKYGYISPEQLGVIDRPIDGRSDIYSLGLVIAAALRGEPLEMGTNWAAVVEARKKVPSLDKCPKALRPLLTSMLAPDPADRPGDMNAVLNRVGEARGSRTGKTARSARSGRSAGSGFVRPAFITLLVLGMLGGGGYAGYLFLSEPASLVDPGMMETPALLDGLPGEPGEPPRADNAAEPPAEEVAALTTQLDLARIREVVEATPCAALEMSVSDDAVVTLEGTVPSAATQTALMQQIQNMAGVAALFDETSISPQPTCEAVALVNPMAQPGLLPLQFNMNDRIYRDGDYLVVLVNNGTGAARHVSVDFFDPSGEVYHLRPNPLQSATLLEADAVAQIGVEPEYASPGVRHYRLGAPYGQAAVVVIASDQPLFNEARPEAELASDYLVALRQALLSQPQSDIITNWQPLEIIP